MPHRRRQHKIASSAGRRVVVGRSAIPCRHCSRFLDWITRLSVLVASLAWAGIGHAQIYENKILMSRGISMQVTNNEYAIGQQRRFVVVPAGQAFIVQRKIDRGSGVYMGITTQGGLRGVISKQVFDDFFSEKPKLKARIWNPDRQTGTKVIFVKDHELSDDDRFKEPIYFVVGEVYDGSQNPDGNAYDIKVLSERPKLKNLLRKPSKGELTVRVPSSAVFEFRAEEITSYKFDSFVTASLQDAFELMKDCDIKSISVRDRTGTTKGAVEVGTGDWLNKLLAFAGLSLKAEASIGEELKKHSSEIIEFDSNTRVARKFYSRKPERKDSVIPVTEQHDCKKLTLASHQINIVSSSGVPLPITETWLTNNFSGKISPATGRPLIACHRDYKDLRDKLNTALNIPDEFIDLVLFDVSHPLTDGINIDKCSK